jgi:hypothetical protein
MRAQFSLLVLLGLISTANAAVSSQEFCQNYLLDKSRIEQVKNNGWGVKEEDTQKTDYLYGCLDLKWRAQLYNNLCLNQNVKITLPQAIVFYFDGFGYFRPVEAKKNLNAVNLLGDEPQGMMSTGVRALGYYIQIIKYSLDWDKKVQLHYHSGSGTDPFQGIENAQACFATMEKDLKVVEAYFPNLVQPKKIIFGHSNGGMNAINFVNYFTKKNDSHFDLLMTLDPVPKMGSFVVNKIFSKKPKNLSIDKKENIARSVNFYQTSNVAVVAGVVGINGSQVEGIDKEIKVENTNHVDIITERIVLNTVTDEILAAIVK